MMSCPALLPVLHETQKSKVKVAVQIPYQKEGPRWVEWCAQTTSRQQALRDTDCKRASAHAVAYVAPTLGSV
jgi:hypothetical protein